MNKFKLVLAAFFAICFTACIQIDEEVDLKEDGSGSMRVRSDMGKMFEMLKGFASEDDLKKDGMEKVMDTTIMMKDIVDTSKNLTAENKALLRNGVLNLKMNMQENLFKMDMNYPFKNMSDANKLYAAMNKGGMMNNVMKGISPGAGAGTNQGGDSNSGLDQIGNMYDVKLANGEYSRTLNKVRYDSVMNDPKMQESKGMMGMMGDMSMNLTVKLPRPAKSVSNPKAMLSVDKKTVILKNDILQALDSPKNMEIVIRY